MKQDLFEDPMQILNIHSRIIDQPHEKVAALIRTMGTQQDLVWPGDYWPKMRFKDGIKLNAHGGHGPIKYYIKKLIPGQLIEFQFTAPSGFDGAHRLEIADLRGEKTEIIHTIDMRVYSTGLFKWIVGIRWLHDAVLEDLLDKVENHFVEHKKRTEWSGWVKFLRRIWR